ncbi:uncharacterized protein FA14DRAFT_158092 [Meira miltonrushii]|uniref:EF-hand domain-containing protein n=1 Tax=Meira miltonrushii TaxID=1280837 RepID=A0A316V3M5_9BASI|nr:uncharacterized protein FA14DRAFT_158092 [Meira miltonrushii]PWN32159.1 hypothetical protein FA14DRAFT_158092 [Meira miltonrushii]
MDRAVYSSLQGALHEVENHLSSSLDIHPFVFSHSPIPNFPYLFCCPLCFLLLIHFSRKTEMPRPLSLRSVSSLSGSIDETSILYNGIEDAYLSATTTNTSVASRSQRHLVSAVSGRDAIVLSDDWTQRRRQTSFHGRRIQSLPYVPDHSLRRNSMDLNILREKNEMNENIQRGKKILMGLFDPNGDGIVWPTNTFFALRRLGFGKLSGLFLSSICHLILAYPLRIVARQRDNSVVRWLPDPRMRIRLDDVQTFNARLSTGEARQIIDQCSSGVRFYSRLRHLHQLDTVDGLGIVLEMRRTAGFGALFTFPFIFIFLRLILPKHSGKTSVEDILNALNGAYFYLLATSLHESEELNTRKRQNRYPTSPKSA